MRAVPSSRSSNVMVSLSTIATSSRVGNGLHAQRQGAVTGPDLPLFPEAPLKFFWKAVDAQIRFTTDASGQVTGAVFVQNGQSLTGNRTQP